MSITVYTLFGAVPIFVSMGGSDDELSRQARQNQLIDQQRPEEGRATGQVGDVEVGALDDQSTAGADDRVEEGPSPIDGQRIISLRIVDEVHVKSTWYALAGNLSRAALWGRLLFGGTSYVIAQPAGKPGPFIVAPTDDRVDLSDLRLGKPGTYEGREAQAIYGSLAWNLDLKGYRLRGLFSPEGRLILPENEALWNEFHTELEQTPAEQRVVGVTTARNNIIEWIQGSLGEQTAEATAKAVERLSLMGPEGYRLAHWREKALFIGELLNGIDNAQREAAVVAIIRSVESRVELNAMFELLKIGGHYHQLVTDMNSHLWSLLEGLGERFGDKKPLTVEQVLDLLEQAGLHLFPTFDMSGDVWELSQTALLELKTTFDLVVSGVGQFFADLVEDLTSLVTQGDQVVEGIVRLAQVQHLLWMAQVGDPKAIAALQQMLRQATAVGQMLGRKAYLVFQGMAVMGAGDIIKKRVAISLILQIASMFIGVGELKAFLAGSRALRELQWAARLGKVLKRVGSATRVIERLEQLAEVLAETAKVADTFQNAAGLLQVVSLLPEPQLARLAEQLKKQNPKAEGALAPETELGQAADEVLVHAEALLAMGRSAGGVDDDVARAYGAMLELWGWQP